MTQLVIAYAPQKPRGFDFGEIQKDPVETGIPDGGTRFGAAVIGDHVNLVGLTVVIEI